MRFLIGRVVPERGRQRPSASTLLLIDPVAESRDVTAMLMRYYGYEVFAASTFTEAMHLARAVRPDGIVTELLDDPRGQGSIVDALRGDAATARIPVLVLSARDTGEGRHQATRAGAAAFLAKPVNGDELRAALAEHVGVPVHVGPSPLAAA
jgi:CheY-like chemotaxis protein